MASSGRAKSWVIRPNVELRFVARSRERGPSEFLCTALMVRNAEALSGLTRLGTNDGGAPELIAAVAPGASSRA
jgi:hypothetical protein